MSTRTFFIPLTSVGQLKTVVGSKDAELEEALIDSLKKRAKKAFGTLDLEKMDEWDREEYEESLSCIHQLLFKKSSVEPGGWVHELRELAALLKLVVKLKLPFVNHDWKHAWIWDEYIDHVAELAGKPAVKLLQKLAQGRPLQGRTVDFDGCTFAWLIHSEMQMLYEALERIEVADDLDEFHQQLVGTLSVCVKKECDLFMGAS